MLILYSYTHAISIVPTNTTEQNVCVPFFELFVFPVRVHGRDDIRIKGGAMRSVQSTNQNIRFNMVVWMSSSHFSLMLVGCSCCSHSMEVNTVIFFWSKWFQFIL